MEDLPVLLFVLMGTLTVISTCVWVADERAEMRAYADADEAAEKLVDALLLQLAKGEEGGVSVFELRSLQASAIDQLRHDDFGWQVSILIIHPWAESICLSGENHTVRTGGHGYANRIINASYGADGSALVEVKCVVWHA